MSCIRASRLLLAVVDAHSDLHRADDGSAKYGLTSSTACGSSRPSASTTTTITCPVRGRPDARCRSGSGRRIERLALALPCMRRLAAKQPDPLPEDAGDRVDGIVVRAIVDDEDDEVVARDRDQPLQAVRMTFSSFRQGIMKTKNRSSRTTGSLRPVMASSAAGQRYPAAARAWRIPPGCREHPHSVADTEDDQERGQQDQRPVPGARHGWHGGSARAATVARRGRSGQVGRSRGPFLSRCGPRR